VPRLPIQSLVAGPVWPPERKFAAPRLAQCASKRRVSPQMNAQVLDLGIRYYRVRELPPLWGSNIGFWA
jgi:hypothetical protein